MECIPQRWYSPKRVNTPDGEPFPSFQGSSNRGSYRAHRELLELSEDETEEDEGCHRHQLPSYLDEFMWFERHGSTVRQAFDNICRDITLKYSV